MKKNVVNSPILVWICSLTIRPFYVLLTRPTNAKETCPPHIDNLSCMPHPGEDKEGSLSVCPRPCWTGRRGSDRCVRQDQQESLPLVTRPFIFICNPAGRQHTVSVVHTDFKTLHGSNILLLLFYPCCTVIGQTKRLPPLSPQRNTDWSL